VMDKGVQYLARIFISVVAIGLLWTSSLAMIVRGLNYFDALPMPQIDDVVFFAETLYNETLRLQVSYVDCVTSNLLFCNISLELKKEREANRVVEAHAENLLTRDLAKGTKDSCYDARGRTLAAVRAWQKRAVANGRPAGLQYRDSCPYAKQQYLEQQTGDLAVEKSEHMALVKGYTGTSRETVGLLADQLQARSAYDYDYVLNKTYRGSAVDKKVQEIAETFSNKVSDAAPPASAAIDAPCRLPPAPTPLRPSCNVASMPRAPRRSTPLHAAPRRPLGTDGHHHRRAEHVAASRVRHARAWWDVRVRRICSDTCEEGPGQTEDTAHLCEVLLRLDGSCSAELHRKGGCKDGGYA